MNTNTVEVLKGIFGNIKNDEFVAVDEKGNVKKLNEVVGKGKVAITSSKELAIQTFRDKFNIDLEDNNIRNTVKGILDSYDNKSTVSMSGGTTAGSTGDSRASFSENEKVRFLKHYEKNKEQMPRKKFCDMNNIKLATFNSWLKNPKLMEKV